MIHRQQPLLPVGLKCRQVPAVGDKQFTTQVERRQAMFIRHRFFWRSLFVFAILFVFSSALWADEEADRSALRKISATYEDALNSNDLAKLKPLLADGFTGVMISGDEIKSFEDLQAFWKKIWDLVGAGGSYHVTVVTDQTDFFGDVAVSRGYSEEVFHTAAGKEFAFRPRWTAITRRQNGEWKIYRVEGTVNPMDNAVVTEIVRRARITVGVSGVVAGLVLGFLAAGGLWGRKKSPRPAAV
jgi:ketosteroid isomerase-like protein